MGVVRFRTAGALIWFMILLSRLWRSIRPPCGCLDVSIWLRIRPSKLLSVAPSISKGLTDPPGSVPPTTVSIRAASSHKGAAIAQSLLSVTKSFETNVTTKTNVLLVGDTCVHYNGHENDQPGRRMELRAMHVRESAQVTTVQDVQQSTATNGLYGLASHSCIKSVY